MVRLRPPVTTRVRQLYAWKKDLYPYLRNVALRRGLLGGQSDYHRFLILGRSRVGSNFLRGLLNSHRQVRVFGELFQNPQQIGWALPGYPSTAGVLRTFREAPEQFLSRYVFHPFPEQIGAVGFKIFYYHADSPQWRPLWRYLADQREIRVIHIKRSNILQTHLSRTRALRSKRWVNTDGTREKQSPIHLDYEECLADFVQTRAWERKYDAIFHEHQKIDVGYEELARGYSTQMERIQQFLGVTPQALSPQTFKQSTQPLAEAIANYHELKERFAGSAWESFFTE